MVATNRCIQCKNLCIRCMGEDDAKAADACIDYAEYTAEDANEDANKEPI